MTDSSGTPFWMRWNSDLQDSSKKTASDGAEMDAFSVIEAYQNEHMRILREAQSLTIKKRALIGATIEYEFLNALNEGETLNELELLKQTEAAINAYMRHWLNENPRYECVKRHLLRNEIETDSTFISGSDRPQ